MVGYSINFVNFNDATIFDTIQITEVGYTTVDSGHFECMETLALNPWGDQEPDQRMIDMCLICLVRQGWSDIEREHRSIESRRLD
jgi:hypothetical protein